MLSGDQIVELVQSGDLGIEGFSTEQLRPSSYALTIGPQLLINDDDQRVDLTTADDSPAWRPVAPVGGLHVLRPGTTYLASSAEQLRLPATHVGLLSLVSRVARVGILANGGAYVVQAGYGSNRPASITFELFNASKREVALPVGMPFCHLLIARHDEPPRVGYVTRVEDQGAGPTPAVFCGAGGGTR